MSEKHEDLLFADIPDPLDDLGPSLAGSSDATGTPAPTAGAADAAMLAALESKLSADPSPTRSTKRFHKASAAMVALAGYSSVIALFGFREDIGKVPLWFLGLHTLPWLMLALILWRAAPRAGVREIWGKSGTISRLLWVFPAAFLVITVASPLPPDAFVSGPRMVRWTWMCGLFTLAMALIGASALLVAFRRSIASGSGLRGAAFGLCAGLLAVVSIKLHCDIEWAPHVLLGHGLPALGAMLFGFVIGRKTLPIS
ncbi:MAG: NrsF family protein [Polyangiaceae bacterium]